MNDSPASSLTSSITSARGGTNQSSTGRFRSLRSIMEGDDSSESDAPQTQVSVPPPGDSQTTIRTDDLSGVPLAEEHFVTNNNSMKILLSMAVGIEDPSIPGTFYGDYNNHPSFPSKQKKSWNPSNDHLFDEIKRRKRIFSDHSNTSTQMRKDGALTWLKANPLTNEVDKAFIVDKVSTFLKEVAAAKNEKNEKRGKASGGDANTTSRQWSGMIPFLRLIHAICDCE